MENPGFLKWRIWPCWLKGMVFGALLGFAVTLLVHRAIYMIESLYRRTDRGMLETLEWCFAALMFLVDLPAAGFSAAVSRLLGHVWLWHRPAWTIDVTCAAINSVSYGLLGLSFGLIHGWARRRRTQRRVNN
jgi:hypothetical protein